MDRLEKFIRVPGGGRRTDMQIESQPEVGTRGTASQALCSTVAEEHFCGSPGLQRSRAAHKWMRLPHGSKSSSDKRERGEEGRMKV